MVGPARPEFVLFGSSIVELSFGEEGWGAILAHLYARKADIVLRGYGGWNSRLAVQVKDQVFPKGAATQPSLVIVYFGGNDSMEPHPSGLSPHVPLPEYLDNMKRIATHLQGLSVGTRIIFLSTPPVNEDQIRENIGDFPLLRTNEGGRRYSEALIELCREMNVTVIDLFAAIQKKPDWLTTCFTDGIHFTAEASKIPAEEILKVLKEVNWVPSLYWDSMPTEFSEYSPISPLP